MATVVTCPPAGCKTILSSACVFYEGMSLLYTDIHTNDPIEIVIQKLNDAIKDSGGGTNFNSVLNYRSNFEVVDGKVYAGYLFNGVSVITRTIDGILENAQNLSNLEVDWVNRLTLTYI